MCIRGGWDCKKNSQAEVCSLVWKSFDLYLWFFLFTVKMFLILAPKPIKISSHIMAMSFYCYSYCYHFQRSCKHMYTNGLRFGQIASISIQKSFINIHCFRLEKNFNNNVNLWSRHLCFQVAFYVYSSSKHEYGGIPRQKSHPPNSNLFTVRSCKLGSVVASVHIYGNCTCLKRGQWNESKHF